MTDRTTTTIPAVRPGLNAWVQLTRHEARMVARDTAGLIIPLGLPILILVMNGLGAGTDPVPEFGGMSPMNAYVVPITLVMVMAVIGIINMPSHLATYRKSGVLRRLAVTPAHPSMVLVAQVIVSVLQTILGLGLALVIGVLAFDVVAPGNLAGAMGTMVLAACAMYAVGMFIAAVSPTANSSVAIGLIAFFATMALGGGFGPRENLPDWLARIGELLPFGAGVEALSASWMGETPELLHLGGLAAVIILAGAAAAALFRWE